MNSELFTAILFFHWTHSITFLHVIKRCCHSMNCSSNSHCVLRCNKYTPEVWVFIIINMCLCIYLKTILNRYNLLVQITRITNGDSPSFYQVVTNIGFLSMISIIYTFFLNSIQCKQIINTQAKWFGFILFHSVTNWYVEFVRWLGWID